MSVLAEDVALIGLSRKRTSANMNTGALRSCCFAARASKKREVPPSFELPRLENARCCVMALATPQARTFDAASPLHRVVLVGWIPRLGPGADYSVFPDKVRTMVYHPIPQSKFPSVLRYGVATSSPRTCAERTLAIFFPSCRDLGATSRRRYARAHHRTVFTRARSHRPRRQTGGDIR